MTLDPVPLAVASRRAAMLTLVGALIVLATLAFGARQLRDVDAKVAAKRQEIARLDGEIASRNQQIAALREQTDQLRTGIDRISREVVRSGDRQLVQATRELAPVASWVRPRASVVQQGPNQFVFSLWVDTDRPDAIQRVTYELNHPSFRDRQLVSSDAASGFRVQYRGWGCLERVVVRVVTAAGATAPIDFDMCKSLGWRSGD
jgi:hypothetical protein